MDLIKKYEDFEPRKKLLFWLLMFIIGFLFCTTMSDNFHRNNINDNICFKQGYTHMMITKDTLLCYDNNSLRVYGLAKSINFPLNFPKK